MEHTDTNVPIKLNDSSTTNNKQSPNLQNNPLNYKITIILIAIIIFAIIIAFIFILLFVILKIHK